MNFKEIEEAYCRTFPVNEVKIHDWILRTSDSEVRRENSVQVYDMGNFNLESQVDECEKLFDELGKLPLFRLFSPIDNSALISILQTRGYTLPDSSHVMVADLQSAAPDLKPAQEGVQFRLNSLDIWVGAYCRISGKTEQQGAKMQKAFEFAESSSCYGTVINQDVPVSIGMIATSNELCGIFNVFTSPEHRGGGHASYLLRSLLSEAKSKGSNTAYLQVSQDNLAALKVYRKIGFEMAYDYSYWVK